jgi:nanoRNase/pAp phosphatase (c-di-AMP/oligoRNAs hydrolase)
MRCIDRSRAQAHKICYVAFLAGIDTDLANFFHAETTKRFNQQVQRSLARFPADFMFQSDAEEAKFLRLQFATLGAAGADDKLLAQTGLWFLVFGFRS